MKVAYIWGEQGAFGVGRGVYGCPNKKLSLNRGVRNNTGSFNRKQARDSLDKYAYLLNIERGRKGEGQGSAK